MKHSLHHTELSSRFFIKLFLPFSFLVLPFFLQGQYYEVGTYMGTSTYVGDLSEQKFRGKFHAMLGIFGRYNFSERIAMKAGFTKGTVAAEDGDSRFEDIRMRNLSFRSDIVEFAVTGELNLIPFHIRAKKASAPYLFAGISAFYFNPQAQWRGEWYNLHEMHTELQSYNRFQVAVPFGLGFKFNLSYKINFGLEFGARKTFTDYLDDVSTVYPDIIQLEKMNTLASMLSYRTPEYTGSFTENPVGQARGDASNKDWYYFLGGTITVNLTDKYGLDYDEKYEPFKEHLKIAKEERKKEIEKRRSKKKKKQRKKKKRKKKRYLEPAVKKRTK